MNRSQLQDRWTRIPDIAVGAAGTSKSGVRQQPRVYSRSTLLVSHPADQNIDALAELRSVAERFGWEIDPDVHGGGSHDGPRRGHGP